MKLDDTVWGGLLVAFAGVLAVHVSSFPKIPGQQVGPNALPTLVAAGLAVCGAIMLVKGVRERLRGNAGAWLELPEWFAHRPQRIAFVALLAVNVFYLLAAERLGFVLTGSVYLFVLMGVLRVALLRAALIAVLMTLAIHWCFYKMLKVPLPWGVLQSVAW